MDRQFIIKSIYMNVIIVFAFFLIFNLWPFTLLEYRYILTVYVLMIMGMVFFECYGLLSELVVRDSVHLDSPSILSVAKASEYILIGGFGVIVLSDILLKLVYDWMGWIFVASYIQYLAVHAFYLIYRKKVMGNSSKNASDVE